MKPVVGGKSGLLVAGCWLLAAGTVAGCSQQERFLVSGCWLLAAGKVAGFWLLVVGSRSGRRDGGPPEAVPPLLLPTTSNQQPTTVFSAP
jgi:hypothetical protein